MKITILRTTPEASPNSTDARRQSAKKSRSSSKFMHDILLFFLTTIISPFPLLSPTTSGCRRAYAGIHIPVANYYALQPSKQPSQFLGTQIPQASQVLFEAERRWRGCAAPTHRVRTTASPPYYPTTINTDPPTIMYFPNSAKAMRCLGYMYANKRPKPGTNARAGFIT